MRGMFEQVAYFRQDELGAFAGNSAKCLQQPGVLGVQTACGVVAKKFFLEGVVVRVVDAGIGDVGDMSMLKQQAGGNQHVFAEVGRGKPADGGQIRLR